MKKAIAMKCTQEQFDAIKGKLNNTYAHIGNFFKFPYLMTEYYDTKQHISNTENPNRFKGYAIYETWNEQIFLEACGIETERVFNGSELQFWNYQLNTWIDCTLSNYTFRFKPNNTLEIEALEKQKLEIEKQIEKLR